MWNNKNPKLAGKTFILAGLFAFVLSPTSILLLILLVSYVLQEKRQSLMKQHLLKISMMTHYVHYNLYKLKPLPIKGKRFFLILLHEYIYWAVSTECPSKVSSKISSNLKPCFS